MKVVLQHLFLLCLVLLLLLVERVIGVPATSLMIVTAYFAKLDSIFDVLFLFIYGVMIATLFLMPISFVLACFLVLAGILELLPFAKLYPVAMRFLMILILNLFYWAWTSFPTHPNQILSIILSFISCLVVGRWWQSSLQKVHIFGTLKRASKK